MNFGPESRGSSQCVGAIFDLTLGSNIVSGSGNPSWVVGDTFLKNVYSVFRATPPSVGFAELSSVAGGTAASSTSASAFSLSSTSASSPSTVFVTVSPATGAPNGGSTDVGSSGARSAALSLKSSSFGILFSGFVALVMSAL
ncbi:hypothetical protein NLJ89_g11387 [Agrocybe chaxingu]|uniref:Peptidase A1 domain-containing protein n=1 Tax=Agrocybe chaxingu TaxID=84603 RepID=A0A9W8JNT9_9AGAR|nr:hypothetical protein NLJ89_g11387 [Agrocybe chaxingu]